MKKALPAESVAQFEFAKNWILYVPSRRLLENVVIWIVFAPVRMIRQSMIKNGHINLQIALPVMVIHNLETDAVILI